MKLVKNLKFPLVLLFSLMLGIIACHKKTPDTPTPQPATPTIGSIDPATAPVGSTIAINGTNLGTSPAGTTVTIGGVPATIISVTPTQIIVTVPVGAMAGPILVTSGGQTVQSPGSFTVATTPVNPTARPISVKQGTISQNQTWTKDSVYMLRGMVYIPENYKLTIMPGTVIKGTGPDQDPQGTNFAGALVIERIGQLIAKGTAAQPIIFTSAKAAGQRNPGDWGGLVLEGKAQVNRPGSTSYPNGVRGTTQAYGEPFDNAGTLQYVRIEYAGARQPTTPATRLAGLSLLGVGAGTTIDHVQVSYCAGDAFSWFGGSVNAKNLFAFRNANDDWTVDWGYVGNVQFGASLRDPAVADASGSNGFEVANYDAAANTDEPAVFPTNGLPQSAPVFANMSCFAQLATPAPVSSGAAGYQSGMYLRRNSAISIYNSVFYGYPEGLRLESISSTTGLTGDGIDLKGVVLANVLTSVVGAGAVTSSQASTYFSAAGRSNQIISSKDLASLLLNPATFSLTAPAFVPQSGSPLLTGAVTGGKVGGAFFTPVTYRGAFGTDNWLAGWTNVNPQSTDYDHQ